jgi:hypothetical protein
MNKAFMMPNEANGEKGKMQSTPA